MANEKRLIDANDALDRLKKAEKEMKVVSLCGCKAVSMDGVIDFVARRPTVKAVPLADIYKVIAGHSNYHGDNILSALTCIAEGKEVDPVKPLPTVDAVEVVHGHWTPTIEPDKQFGEMDYFKCSVCGKLRWFETNYCPNCGADMRERKDNG